jgi:hypothetical protein
MSAREVVLYYSHVGGPSVRREVARLRSELGDEYDVIVIGYCRQPHALAGLGLVPTRAYSAADLSALPYREKLRRFTGESYLGYADLVPLRFFQEQPDCRWYWLIENDLRFCGNWAELFRELSASDADLLGTTVQSYADNPGWAFWDSLRTGGAEVPPERRVKSFVPLGRFSRRLFEACDARYRCGWSGHSEVLWATIASEAGFRIEDIGGSGRFTPPARRGRFYYNNANDWSMFPGTCVYRPCFAERDLERFPGWLWHPVKSYEAET